MWFHHRAVRAASLLLVVAVLGGCASAVTQVVAPGYEEKVSYRPTVLVMPLAGELTGEAVDTYAGADDNLPKGYVNPRDRSLFYRYFGPLLGDVTTAYVMEIDEDFRPEGASFAYRVLPVGNDTVEVVVPTGGQVVHPEETPDFLLIVDDLYFTLNTRDMQQGAAPIQATQVMLNGSFEYVLWDNNEQRPAAYGSVLKSTHVPDGLSREAYLRVLQELAAAVVEQGPLTYRLKAY